MVTSGTITDLFLRLATWRFALRLQTQGLIRKNSGNINDRVSESIKVGPIATASFGEHLGFPRTLEFLGVVLLLCSPLILLLGGNYQRSRSMNYEPIRRNSHSVYFENGFLLH
jgi:hypothetical protein